MHHRRQRHAQREGRSEKQVGAPTICATYQVLSTALNTMVKDGYIATNPCASCPKPRTVRKELSVLTKAECHRFLLAAVSSNYFALFVLAVTTGMRQGELFGLKWNVVDFAAGSLAVVVSVTDGEHGKPILSEPKTSASRRRIELPQFALGALRAHRKAQMKNGYEGDLVFPDSDGGLLRKSNFIRREFQPLVVASGVPLSTFHSLRHTANTLLIEEGVSVNVLAQRMGHTTTRMTLDTYGHVLPTAQGLATEKLDRIFAEFGGHSVVNPSSAHPKKPKKNPQEPNVHAGFELVEMRRFELLTPYMRSKCSTS